jgi:hypothetical protein
VTITQHTVNLRKPLPPRPRLWINKKTLSDLDKTSNKVKWRPEDG